MTKVNKESALRKLPSRKRGRPRTSTGKKLPLQSTTKEEEDVSTPKEDVSINPPPDISTSAPDAAASAALTAALYYFDRGISVTPCCTMTPDGQCTFPHIHRTERSIGKVPLLGEGWQNVRLTRDEVIDRWTRDPNANVGVMLNPPDPPEGAEPQPEAPESIRLLIIDTDSDEAEEEAARLGLPPGPQTKTGKGNHHYYLNPKGIIANTTKRGESGKIDILTWGIIVGFGSIHRNGTRYEQLVSFDEWPLEEAPMWAEALVLDAIKTKSTAANIPDELPLIEVDDLSLPPWISTVIRTGKRSSDSASPDRSKALWCALLALIEANSDDTTIASLLLDPRYGISAKPLEKGVRWLAGEIGRARAIAQTSPSQEPEESNPQGRGEEKAKAGETLSDPQGGMGTTDPPGGRPEAPPNSAAFGFETYNGLTLRNTAFQPLEETIPDVLPIGLTVVAGPPKIGKSFLVLNIACAIAAGGKAFSRFDVKGGACCYLALEDSPRRMQKRLLSLLGDFEEWPNTLPDITHRAPLSGAGLEEMLTRWVTTHPGARLIIIDTLAKVKPPRQRGQDPYQEDYQISARLQQLALKHDIAILLVHHTKKGPEEDFLSAVSGTYGVTGAADAVWVLKRKRGELAGTLSVTGRDIEERDLAMKTIDGDWLCLGDATEVRRSASRKQILEALVQANLTPAGIAAATNIQRGTVRQLLRKMLTDGEVFKVAEQYTLLPPQGGE